MWVPFSCHSCLLFFLLENKTVYVSATYGDKTQSPWRLLSWGESPLRTLLPNILSTQISHVDIYIYFNLYMWRCIRSYYFCLIVSSSLIQCLWVYTVVQNRGSKSEHLICPKWLVQHIFGGFIQSYDSKIFSANVFPIHGPTTVCKCWFRMSLVYMRKD